MKAQAIVDFLFPLIVHSNIAPWSITSKVSCPPLDADAVALVGLGFISVEERPYRWDLSLTEAGRAAYWDALAETSGHRCAEHRNGGACSICGHILP
jgi:hypothetical protein